MILLGTFHIYKSKFNNSKPCLKVSLADFMLYIESLKCIDNKKCTDTIVFAKELEIIEL